MRSLLRSIFAVLVLAGTAWGQQTSIIGKVTDTSGRVIASATVIAQVQGGGTYKTLTDGVGIFQLPGLAAASYDLKITAEGFAESIDRVQLLLGQAATVNITLKPAGDSTSVTVTNTDSVLETTTSEVAGNIDPEQMQKIPLNGRNYMDLTELVPGIRRNAITNYSPLGSLNGGREQFNLDGQQVTANGADASFGQAQFSRDAISQFQVITNQFDATQGRTDQLVMNMQSKSGTNPLHGSAFGYFRNDVFDAADPVTHTVLPFSDEQYGGTLGGRIVTDKLWYFGSYEGEHRPQQTTTTPFGFVAQTYNFSNTLNNNEYLARGDYQPSRKDHIFARYFYFSNTQPDLVPSGTSSISRQYTSSLSNYGVIGSWTRTIAPNLVNTFFGSWFYQSNLNQPLVPSIQFTFPSQVIGAAYNYPSHLPVSVFQFRDDAFWLKGRHSVKAGFEYLRELNDGSFPQNVRGVATVSKDPTGFSTPLSWDQAFPNQLDPTTWNYAAISPYVTAYTQGFGNFNTNIKRNILGVWAQDDWKVLPRLTLNLGVRYDNDLGLITAGSVNINGVVGPTQGNNLNFSPRFGLAYDVFGTGKTVVRGGLGIYFAEIVANQSIDGQLFNGVQTVQAAATISSGFSLTDPFNGVAPSTFIQNPQNVYQAIQVEAASIRTPWSGEGSIGVQQEIASGITASLDYSQLRVHHDWARGDANTVFDPSTGWNQVNIGAANAAKGCPNGCVTSRVQPNSHYSTIATFYTPDYVSSQLKNILASVRARTRFGLSGLLSYTYGLEKDNSGGPFSYASNPYNYANEWANSVDDQRHTMAAEVDYQWKWGIRGGLLYHFGSGLAYAPTVGGTAPTALVLSSSANRSFCLEPSGYTPYSVLPGSLCSHLSAGAAASGGASAVAASYVAKVYNSAAHDHFDAATGLTTVDRNSFRGLPIERVDANLAKSLRIHDRYVVTTTVEAFNLLNHSNFGSYNTVITSSTYGQPASTSGVLGFYARQLQFAARLDF